MLLLQRHFHAVAWWREVWDMPHRVWEDYVAYAKAVDEAAMKAARSQRGVR